jgi:hypothetical protein
MLLPTDFKIIMQDLRNTGDSLTKSFDPCSSFFENKPAEVNVLSINDTVNKFIAGTSKHESDKNVSRNENIDNSPQSRVHNVSSNFSLNFVVQIAIDNRNLKLSFSELKK